MDRKEAIGNGMDLNKVYCADSLIKTTEFPSGSFDFIVTGPSYGTTLVDHDEEIPAFYIAEEYRRLLKKDGVLIIQCKSWLYHNLYACLWRIFKKEPIDITWNKNRFGCHKKALTSIGDVKENFFVTSAGKLKTNPVLFDNPFKIPTKRTCKDKGMYNAPDGKVYTSENPGIVLPTTIVEMTQIIRPKNSIRWHESITATSILRWFIESFLHGDPKKMVLGDFFCGSGTSLMAGMQLGMSVVGIDKKPKYAKLSQELVDVALETGPLNIPFKTVEYKVNETIHNFKLYDKLLYQNVANRYPGEIYEIVEDKDPKN